MTATAAQLPLRRERRTASIQRRLLSARPERTSGMEERWLGSLLAETRRTRLPDWGPILEPADYQCWNKN